MFSVEVREKMNNVVYALLPFLLFGAILGLLLNERFSEKKTRVIYGAVFFFVFVFHLAFGLASFDNAFLLSLMPLTAYLPMIVLFYALSKRNFACNTFVVLLGIIASLIALLFKKTGTIAFVQAFGSLGILSDILLFALCLLVCVLLGWIVYRYPGKFFRDEEITDKRIAYIDVLLFFLIGLSLYLMNTTYDPGASVLLFLSALSVFLVIVDYLNTKRKGRILQREYAEIERQIKAERDEYRQIERGIELGKRYRHDMRHHFAVIKGLIRQGNASQAERYIETLNDDLSDLEQQVYCGNAVINAVLSSLLGKARQSGIDVRTEIRISDAIAFDHADLCVVLSNAIENAINASLLTEEENRRIAIAVDGLDPNKFTLSVRNGVKEKIPLNEDGLPSGKRSENHGYGLASIRHIVEKYRGLLHCTSSEETFELKVVLFSRINAKKKSKSRHLKVRSVATVPLLFGCGLLLINLMPETLDTLNEVPVIGKATPVLDFRSYGFGWGDNRIQVEYPKTDGEDVNRSIEEYVRECEAKYRDYLKTKYNGYVSLDIRSEVVTDDECMLILSVSCTINAGSSFDDSRHFVIDKASGKEIFLSDLFAEESDYKTHLNEEIARQIEYRVGSGDFYFGYGIWEDEPVSFDLDDLDFYLDGDYRLTVVFSEGQIAPNSMGKPTFVIPSVVTNPIAAENSLLKGGNR